MKFKEQIYMKRVHLAAFFYIIRYDVWYTQPQIFNGSRIFLSGRTDKKKCIHKAGNSRF